MTGDVAAMIFAMVASLAGGDCPPPPEGPRAAEAADAFAAGVEHVVAERWAEAEQAFLGALAADAGLPLAHYGLGQARMALRRYAEAATAFEESRDAFLCAASLSQEARRASEQRIDAAIRTLREALRDIDEERLARERILWQEVNGDPKPRLGEVVRRKEAIESQIASLERLKKRRTGGPPPEVSLALGSAYFQTGALAEAEREFRATLASDPESGDAHNDLAVVLMLTGRLDEAERAVRAAEKHGVAVSPRLKEEIRQRKASPKAP